MRFFIDTEFTDFIKCDLISIALVSEHGEAFYAEAEFDSDKLSDFARETVLPLLDHHPLTVEILRKKLVQWLKQFEDSDVLEICHDFKYDYDFLREILKEEMPLNMIGVNVGSEIDPERLASYFENPDIKKHHALHDAQALRFAVEN